MESSSSSNSKGEEVKGQDVETAVVIEEEKKRERPTYVLKFDDRICAITFVLLANFFLVMISNTFYNSYGCSKEYIPFCRVYLFLHRVILILSIPLMVTIVTEKETSRYLDSARCWCGIYMTAWGTLIGLSGLYAFISALIYAGVEAIVLWESGWFWYLFDVIWNLPLGGENV
jgi:hypothetical protein